MFSVFLLNTAHLILLLLLFYFTIIFLLLFYYNYNYNYNNYYFLLLLWLKYLFGPHFRSVCCGWSSFWHNV